MWFKIRKKNKITCKIILLREFVVENENEEKYMIKKWDSNKAMGSNI